jgi:replicative DNA helicase
MPEDEEIITLGDLFDGPGATSDKRSGEDPTSETWSVEAERGVVGSVFLDSEFALRKCEEAALTSDDFYFNDCRNIFSAFESLQKKARKIDPVTVMEELSRQARLSKIGGPAKVSELSASCVSPVMSGVYAEIIVEKSKLRSLGDVLNRCLQHSRCGSMTSGKIMDAARREISAIETSGSVGDYDMKSIAQSVLESLPALGGTRETTTTGFVDLDNLVGGFGAGDLVIIAGRPSMGKTCIGLDMARHVGIKDQKPVMVFSLEMTSEQLMERLIAAESGVSTKKPSFTSSEAVSVTGAAGIVGESPILIDDTGGISVSQIRSRARQAHIKFGLGLIVVDYIQLLGNERNLENRVGEMSETSNALKRLAKELKVPIIVMSQLNRGPESRLDKRPLMSDLRESGAIEQDADIVALLYREEYYAQDKTPDDAKGIAELIISKNRNGPTGKVKLKFVADIPSFKNLADLSRHNGNH